MRHPLVLLVPSLPTLVLDEHRGHRTPMLEALAGAAEALAHDRPDVVLVLTARWETEGPFAVDVGARHRTLTDYTGLGVEVRYDCSGKPALAKALVAAGHAAGVRVGPAQRGVDSGVTVPMHFLFGRSSGVAVVPLSVADADAAACRAWGAAIATFAARRPERILFVVGGVLSHDEHAWNFRRNVPETAALDETVMTALGDGDWQRLHHVPPHVRERAKPQAGLRHLEVLRGYLGADLRGQVLAYETQPGIGAALVSFAMKGVASDGMPPPPEATEAAEEAPADSAGEDASPE